MPLHHVSDFEKLYLELLHARYREEVLDRLKEGILDEKVEELMTAVAAEVTERFKI